MLYPLFFIPVYKDYIWGGTRIREAFHRTEILGKVAESWEISCHLDGMSIVENGPLKGKSLLEIFESDREALMGKDARLDHFPLLLKIIDAADHLSVQVHPSTGKEAKTECWYLLESQKDSVVYAGFKDHFPKEEILKKLPSDEILELMRKVPVNKGEMISIPGGDLHAIGAGCLIFEIQQTSNTTYRIYDWGRGRKCHLEEAKSVILYENVHHPRIVPKVIHETPSFTQVELIRTPFFIVEKWEIKKKMVWPKKENQCEFLFCVSGENSLVPMGRSSLIPAMCTHPVIETEGSTLLRAYTT